MEKDNKRFYWIRLKTNFFDRKEIDFILSQKNGCEYIVLYQMLCLSTANTDGRFETQINEVIVPYDIDKIVRDTKYFDYDTVAVAIELFKKLGLIYEEEDNILRITNHSELVGSESATRDAIKKREYRQRLKEKKIKEEKILLGTKEGTKEGTNCPIEYRDKSIDNSSSCSSNNKSEPEEKDFIKIYESIEENMGILISPLEKEIVDEWVRKMDPELIIEAIKTATINQVKTIGYLNGILNNYEKDGYKTIEDYRKANEKKETKTPPKEIFDYDWLNEE